MISVELDGELTAQVRSAGWPQWVSIPEGDGANLVGTLGSFDLIFLDAPRGKIFKLRKTVTDLRPGGIMVVDDMDLSQHPMMSYGKDWPRSGIGSFNTPS